jgi:hypothetical protein
MRSVARGHETARRVIGPPQRGHRHPSTANTRHNSSAQVRYLSSLPGFALFNSAGRCDADAGGAGTTSRRQAERPASTPWVWTRCARGGGTRAARRHPEEPGGGLFKTRPRERGSGQVPTQAFPSPSVSPANGDAAVQRVAAPACTPARQRVRANPDEPGTDAHVGLPRPRTAPVRRPSASAAARRHRHRRRALPHRRRFRSLDATASARRASPAPPPARRPPP